MKNRILFAFITILLLTGCRNEPKYRIGVSQCSSDDWREQLNDQLRREAIFNKEIDLEIRSAEDDNDRQIADLDYFANNGFDAIIVSPNQAEAITPKIKEIYDKGMPIVVFDRNTTEPCYSAFVGADNKEIGNKVAEFAYHQVANPIKVLEIEGLPGSTPAIDRASGFDSIVAEYDEMEVVGRGIGNWNYEDAYRVADSLLALYPDANVVYAHNDRMAIGASDAIKKHGLKGIKIYGIDAAPHIGLEAVKNGIIDASFIYPTQGTLLMETALNIVKGLPYDTLSIAPTPAAVTDRNVEFLLLSDDYIEGEVLRVNDLKMQVDQYWSLHRAQSAILYSLIAILVLLSVLIYVIVKAYWANKRHSQTLESQKKQLEEQQEKLTSLYEQLKEATQSKLTFFTNVSHDLRTPLTLIADPVEQIASADNLTQKQSVLMQLANKNVKVLMRLINQILDFRKAENGAMELHLVEIDLKSAITEWSEAFAQAAKKKNLDFKVEFAEGNYRMAVDAGKMERVYFNLISNAFKYTPNNGSVTVNVDIVGEQLRIKVADTGIGMTAEAERQVFERFFQVDQNSPNGSGIGLALTKVFIEMHGGTIAVESEVGKGSTFTLLLPIVHTEAQNVEYHSRMQADQVAEELAEIEDIEPEDSDEEIDKPTLLVIDDNADIRTMINGLMCDKYRVLQAGNGPQGIRMASRFIPDIIICDVMMPGIDGLEVCRRLKAEMTTSHIPVLLLTACAMDQQRIDGYDSGADAYLAKPFNFNVLIARCEALILNRRRIMATGNPQSNEKEQTPVVATQASVVNGTTIDDEFYNKFVDAVNKNLSNPDLTVEDLASMMGLSRVQFYRKIKALTNYSPAELLRTMRLKRAERLLKTTQSTVSEICYSVGFSSPSYFTKCYREQFGESPTETQEKTSKCKE